uniref:Enoyl-CoA hydratase domain-containing protein 3, mitochondrial n=1 Tax=Cacopsylla melanoneura TaxID=428564 RepID=A0A8D8Q0U9_9HEMI
MHSLRHYIMNSVSKVNCKWFQTSCSYSSQSLILVNEENGVRHIVMNDQKTRNALSVSMMMQLMDAINKDRDNPQLRCITLRSSHAQVFSSGHNLKQMALDKVGQSELQHIFTTCSKLMLSILKHPVPIIAIISGVAAAAGCQLVASCDIALATDSSRFSTPGARHGIFCSTPAVALYRKIPEGVVRSMTITGIPITAQYAYTVGLVTKVISSDKDLENEIKIITNGILENSRSVLALGKQFLYQQLNMSIEEAYKVGGDTMVQNLCLQDGVEGMNAFIEKRHPQWSHSEEIYPLK